MERRVLTNKPAVAATGLDARLAALLARHRPGFSLAAEFYTEPAIYALELERVVYRNWILAGHESEWSAQGDYRAVAAGAESAIIVRGTDGELRAFANVCRHRGSRICLDDAGRADALTCPYHGWRYALDGELTHAREMPDGFERRRYGLKALPLALVHGLVFVAFAAPPSLAAARDALREPMAWFGFESLRVAARRRYEIPANWKLAIENYQECYHCAPAHPEYAARHTLMLAPKRRARLQADMRERFTGAGLRELEVDRIDTRAPDGQTGFGYSRTALFDGYLTGSRDGKPVAPLLGELTDYDSGASDFSFGGANFLLAYSDHVVAYVFTPVDHQNAALTVIWFVKAGAEAGRDYDESELTWLWDHTTRQDIEIITNNARGVRSQFHEPGPLSTMEAALGNWLDWYLTELAREEPA